MQDHNDDQNIHDRQANLRVVADTNKIKPPRQFRIGDDIEMFLQRFITFCNTNNIGEIQKIEILLNNFDNEAYKTALRLKLHNCADFDEICQKLIERFGPAEGKWGELVKLRTRKRNVYEKPSEFLEILGELSSKVGGNDETMATAIIESFINNVEDKELRDTIIKLHLKQQERGKCAPDCFDEMTQKIKHLERSSAISKLHEDKEERIQLNALHDQTLNKQRQEDKIKNLAEEVSALSKLISKALPQPCPNCSKATGHKIDNTVNECANSYGGKELDKSYAGTNGYRYYGNKRNEYYSQRNNYYPGTSRNYNQNYYPKYETRVGNAQYNSPATQRTTYENSYS